MNFLATLLSLVLTVGPAAWALEPDKPSDIDLKDPATLQEATRVLAEEIKLATRPQTYILIDLVANAILIKARGLELHRLPLKSWRASRQHELGTTFRLHERPPVTRRKIDPTISPEQDPISLADMPIVYSLQFTPAFTVTIDSYDRTDLWGLVTHYARLWWDQVATWWHAIRGGDLTRATPQLSLTVSVDHAQSLAWTLTDGMPLVIRRPTR